jgi:hypothetical protein
MAEKIVKDSQGLAKDLANDCISRKAAIDALGERPMVWAGSDYELGARNQYDADVLALETVPSVQPEPRWVSCSERLPEHGGRYLISVLDGVNRRTTVAPYLPRCKAWTMTGRMAYWKVIAWMPLPEPYKEEEQDG